jgi:sec-independent protein translocase protein TatB
MFDLGFGFGELIVLALVALIVIGPHDLPHFFFKIGKFISNIRNISSDFKQSIDDIVHEQEIDKIKKDIEAQKINIPQETSHSMNSDIK